MKGITVVGVGTVAALVGWYAHSFSAHSSEGGTATVTQSAWPARLDALERQQQRQLSLLSSIQRELTRLRAEGERGGHPTATEAEDTSSLDAGAQDPPEESEQFSSKPDEMQASMEAGRIIEDAQRAGMWTDVDSHRLEGQLRRMSAASADEMRRSVIAALNRGELEVAFSGRPAF